MKARFLIEEPEEIQGTIKITMSIREWTLLRDSLQEHNVFGISYPLCSAITDLISQARKVYFSESEGREYGLPRNPHPQT